MESVWDLGGTAEKPTFTGVSGLFLPRFEDLYQMVGQLRFR